MSATEVLAKAFAAMCEAFCDMRSCDDCPLYAATYPGENCLEAFARLLRESKAEPWEARVVDGKWCSICAHKVPAGAETCPTCGAIIARGAEARSDGRYDESVSPYPENGETSRETARESLVGGAAIR